MTWVTTPQLYKSRIYIIEDPTQGKGRKVTTEFVDVRCTNYELGMDGVYLELNAAGFRREDVAYESYWKTTTFSADQNTDVTTREEPEVEPTILSTHYEDEAGNRIKDLDLGKAILVIKTQDGAGKYMNLDLADEKFDFLYKGKRLKNDLLEKLAIASSDITRVALEVVPEDDAEGESASRMGGGIPTTDERPKFKAPKSLIDVPEVPNPKKIDGIIYPNAPKIPNIPKVPELSEDALKNIPKNMQGVITDYPDDVLPDAIDEKMRQEVIIAAANPKDIDLKEKGINAGQALFGKAITAIAVAGTAYSLFKSGQKMVKQVESVGKFLKKVF